MVMLILPRGLELVPFLDGLGRLLSVWLLLVRYFWVFRSSWAWPEGKNIPAGLHAAEASYVSSSSLSAFRAAIGWAVWSSKMLVSSTLVILNLLDGPVGIDLAIHIIWARYRMMRRYLACCPEEEPGIFRCWI